ncbi:hypothetical protein Trydic_g23169 [Trypoxylus dichotomus]
MKSRNNFVSTFNSSIFTTNNFKATLYLPHSRKTSPPGVIVLSFFETNRKIFFHGLVLTLLLHRKQREPACRLAASAFFGLLSAPDVSYYSEQKRVVNLEQSAIAKPLPFGEKITNQLYTSEC